MKKAPKTRQPASPSAEFSDGVKLVTRAFVKAAQHEDQRIALLGVPTIAERIKRAMLAATLIKAATEHRPDNFVDADLWEAINSAAVDVYEELFVISELPAPVLKRIAPNADQQRDIDRSGGRTENAT